MTIQNPDNKPRRWPYWLGGLVVAVVVLLGLTALLGPGILKNQLMQRGSEALKRPVKIESLSLNPFTLQVELKGVSVGTLDGQHEQLGLDRLWVNVDIEHVTRQAVSADLQVNAFRWQDDAGQPLLAAGLLQVPVKRSSLKENRHAVGVVELTGVVLNAARDAKGQINLLAALDQLLNSLPKTTEPEAPPETPTTPVEWSVEQVVLKEAKVAFVDRQTPGHTPAEQQVLVQHLTLAGLDQTLAEALPVSLAAQINQTGQLKTDGTLHLKPFSTDLKIDLNSLPLKPIQPYIDDALNLILKDGQLDTQAELQMALPPEKPMQLGVKGQVVLRDFASADPLLKEPFLSWKSLAVKDIDLGLGQKNDHIRLGKIQFDDFFARLIVSQAGELNVLKIAKQGKAEATNEKPTPQKAVKPAQGPVIKVGEVAFNRGKVLFSDRFVKPNYTAKIEQVNGQIKGLSSVRNELAEMRLGGRYNQVSPVNVNARLNLLADKRFLDLAAKVTSIELTSFNPYAGRYAGYNIEKGKLSLDLSYKLEDQQLKAENRVFLDQLTFGDKVDSPDATSLPVRLAVSMLKNRKGEIDINLPISGSLDDPQFSVGGIILQVLGNLIVKAVTAPFSLIASMFEGGDQLSSIPFQAASVDLTPEAVKRLSTLAKVLDDRPALHLEVTGRADPEADAAALKAAKTFKRSVGEDELRHLAQRRAQATQLWLVEQGKVPAERVFLLPPKLGNEADKAATGETGEKMLPPLRVDFSLR